MDVLSAAKDIGPLIGIVAFFVWRDYVRERKQVARIEALERYQKKVLQRLVERSNLILLKVVEAIKK